MPSSLQTELDKLGFDWEANGHAVLQMTGRNGNVVSARVVDAKDPILQERWPNGASVPHLPRFLAQDDRGIYYPHSDQHGSGLAFVATDLTCYLGAKLIPYPGD